MIKKIKYFFQTTFILLFFFIIKILRISLSRKIFSNFFLVFGPIFKSNKVIMSNLDKIQAFSFQEKKEIKNKMWKNYGKTFSEYMYLKEFRTSNFHIKIRGEEILEKILKEKKPVIFVSGHFANFELMAMEITKKEINLATIYRPLNNYFLNPLMEKLRKKYICPNQIKKGLSGVKKSIEYLNQNYSIAMMIDQRVSEGEKINFFNNLAYTTTLPAQLAIKREIDIVPIYLIRDEFDKFTMSVYEPLKVDKSNDFELEKINISKKLNKILEEMISLDPSQWILTHDRWK